MAGKTKTGSGGARKIRRSFRSRAHKKYVGENIRLKNKIKRIRQSNGEKYLTWWLAAHGGITERRPGPRKAN